MHQRPGFVFRQHQRSTSLHQRGVVICQHQQHQRAHASSIRERQEAAHFTNGEPALSSASRISEVAEAPLCPRGAFILQNQRHQRTITSSIRKEAAAPFCTSGEPLCSQRQQNHKGARGTPLHRRTRGNQRHLRQTNGEPLSLISPC